MSTPKKPHVVKRIIAAVVPKRSHHRKVASHMYPPIIDMRDEPIPPTVSASHPDTEAYLKALREIREPDAEPAEVLFLEPVPKRSRSWWDRFLDWLAK
jgi:hypothetical protein